MRAGTTKVNPKDSLTYVRIPPGAFTMGCSPGDDDCADREKPHQVTITKGFWMGQTEVTQEAYQRVMRSNPSSFRGTKLPVEKVSWSDAHSYCESAGMRLPTEAEWEYSARAGSTSSRYGDIDQIAWYRGNSQNTTHDAGRKKPNAWNLYDMLGNVWQWTADWYEDYQAGAQRDPSGPSSGHDRVLRGGSWNNPPDKVRVSLRLKGDPRIRYNYIGFRCVGN